MRSSKIILAILVTAMLILTLCILNFVTDELSIIEDSVQIIQQEHVKQLSRVVEIQERVNKVPWLVSRFIFTENAEKRQYIQKQIISQIEMIDQDYISNHYHRDDEKALYEYVSRNWSGYKDTVYQIINFSKNTYEAQNRMEDSLLYLERVNDGMRMIVAFHERDVAEKTDNTLNSAIQARRNVLFLAVVAVVTFLVAGLAAFRKIMSTEDQLRIQAYCDTLTGLPNRLSFQKSLSDALRAEDSQVGGAIVFLDMDNFKLVNDQYGHDAGDRFLIVIGDRIRSLFNENVFGARFGGDEFVLFLRNATQESADLLIKELLRLIGEPVQIEGKAVLPTASIGVAFSPQHGHSAAELLKSADIAMYKAKEKKRSYVIDDVSALEDITARQPVE